MVITKETELTSDVKETLNFLKLAKGGNLKITDLPSLLETVSGVKIEDLTSWTSQFVSYLIDLQKKFMGGGELDLTVFHQDVNKVFHFSKIERQLLVKNNIEEKLWAIMVAVSPNL